jgi:hypothetical protein
MKRLIYLILFTLAIANVNAQKITRLEYFFDEDPGFGFATPVDIAPDAQMVNNFNFTASTLGLSIGYHNFYFRTLNDSGRWSHTYQRQIEVFASYQPLKITRGEYYIDEDFGFGYGTSFPIIGGAGQNVNTNLNIPTASLSIGSHVLIFRMLDSLGYWSQTYTRTFEKVEDQNPQIIAYEYAVNVDPGYGLATRVNLTTPFVDDEISFVIPVTSLPEGPAKAFVRTLNSNGKWSQTMIKDFSVCNSLPNVEITFSGNTAICGVGSVTLNAPIGTGFTYVWKRDGTNITGATNAVYNASLTGAYTVVVTTPTGCSAESQAVNITQSSNPTANITTSTTTICSNDSTPINANTGAGLTYQWRLNGSAIPGANASTFYANLDGAYTVIVSNASGCSALSNSININTIAAPTAVITQGAAVEFCAGNNITLQATTGTGFAYQWKNGGINIASATSANYFTNASGIYTVTITAGTCSATSTPTTVTVNPLPFATITPNGPTTFCSGTSLLLNANSSATLLYQWKLNGTPIVVATFDNYSVTQSGSYTVTTSDVNGCSNTSSPLVVTVIPTVTPTISISNTIPSSCVGLPINFTASTTNGGTFPYYQWQVNGTNIALTNNPNFVINNLQNSDVVTALLFSNEQCLITPYATSNAISPTITTVDYGLAFSANNTNPGVPFDVVFSNGSVGGSNIKYTWHFGDGTISNDVSPLHYYPANGVFSVTLFAQDTISGCMDTLRFNDYITCGGGSGQYNCVHTANISPNATITGCVGGKVKITATTNATNPTYQWNINGVPIGGETQATIDAFYSGFYSVTVFENGGCPITSSAVLATFNLPAPAAPIITEIGSLLSCASSSMTLTASAGFSNYLWNTGETTASINISTAGVYTVIGTNNPGCNVVSNPAIINNSAVFAPDVCLVTVDSLTNHNIVIWDKTSFDSTQVDSFIVFKESIIAGVYNQVGAVAYADLSEFTDVASNGLIHADRYKIAIRDYCANLTLPSNFYKTMHLQVTPGNATERNLSWTHAEGITDPYYYQIYRYDGVTRTLIDSVQSNLSTYTDLNAPTQTVSYRIEIVITSVCESTRAAYGKSKSNVGNNQVLYLVPVGVPEDIKFIEHILLLPNPSDGNTMLQWESNKMQNLKIVVNDVVGKTISSEKITAQKGNNNYQISVDAAGVYFVTIFDERGSKNVLKMVVK